MSKAVLFSIKPKYCELIASGKKTIEVRKTQPKIDVPFKGYIYCTKDFYKAGDGYFQGKYCGKVIGEFVCDNIIKFAADKKADNIKLSNMELLSCLSSLELENYAGDKYYLYGFHISDLVIYDNPKDLDEFMAFGKSNCDCKNCDNCLYMSIDGVCDIKDSYQPLFRPPQSWCYVEELI